MPKVYPVSDRAIQLDWSHPSADECSPPALHALAQNLKAHLQAKRWPPCQVIQADHSISLVFSKPPSVPLVLSQMLMQIPPMVDMLQHASNRTALPASHQIVVNYGGPAGQDLEWLASQTGLGTSEIVELHISATYTVQFLGFLPGFAYLAGLPEVLQLPRRSTPRARVPAGTLAIGARYCAIYPWESPGGWHLLGHVEQVLFDPEARDGARPSLFQAGDTVRFIRGDHA